MELFASPMACSLASHITALEAGLPVKVRFVKDKKTDDGGDYYGVSTHGYARIVETLKRAAATAGCPMALVTEGGYDLDALRACLEATLQQL